MNFVEGQKLGYLVNVIKNDQSSTDMFCNLKVFRQLEIKVLNG